MLSTTSVYATCSLFPGSSRNRTCRITSLQLRSMWGDPVSISDRVRHRQLQWLGHVARMDVARLPKRILFSSLPFTRPACGPRLRWKDVVSRLLSACGCRGWFGLTGDRHRWREEVVCFSPSADPVPKLVVCPTCLRSFRRPSDMGRHKCTAVRLLPLQLQPGAIQCPSCSRWFASAGGLAVHHCRAIRGSVSQPLPVPTQRPPLPAGICGAYPVHCPTCDRCFRTHRRHSCLRGQRPSASARAEFPHHCDRCQRRFSRLQDVKRHLPFCS